MERAQELSRWYKVHIVISKFDCQKLSKKE